MDSFRKFRNRKLVRDICQELVQIQTVQIFFCLCFICLFYIFLGEEGVGGRHDRDYMVAELLTVSITTTFMRSNLAHGDVYSIQPYAINLVSDLLHVCGFLWVLRFPAAIQLTAPV